MTRKCKTHGHDLRQMNAINAATGQLEFTGILKCATKRCSYWEGRGRFIIGDERDALRKLEEQANA